MARNNMAKKITPYQNSNSSKKNQVREMFDTISGNYDGLNRMMTFGIDRSWRKQVVALVSKTKPKKILDIATGTGDLAIMLAQIDDSQVTGLDLSPGMLEIGKQKVFAAGLDKQVDMVIGDSEKLPFDDDSYDAITVSYGVRNFEDLNKGLLEINRVLRPGGILVILETSLPTKFPYKQGYNVYSKTLLPLLGTLFSKDKEAYSYLSNSAKAFPFGKEFNKILEQNSFTQVKDRPVTMGVSTIYTAFKS